MYKTMGKLFGDDKLYIMYPVKQDKMMGFVLEREKKLLVIDGGTENDADSLEQLLIEKGASVDCWIITHAHFDHIGAAYQVMNRGKVEVKQIVYDFPSEDYIDKTIKDPQRRETVRNLDKIIQEKGIPTLKPDENTEYELGGFAVYFLKNGKSVFSDDINDTSLVFKVRTRKNDILFLADVLSDSCDYLLKKYGAEALSCPVCQLSHHGADGATEELYRAICPKYAIWTLPKRLWENVDEDGNIGKGTYNIDETRDIIKELGAKDITAFDKIERL